MNRRRFLKALSTGAFAALTVPSLRRIQAGAHREIAATLHGIFEKSGLSGLKNAYTLSPEITYLNHGSIGTMPTSVQNAYVRYLQECESNPWLYMWGGAWEEGRQQARQRAAELLGCNSANMALTHNTTEGFNVLAQGLPLGRGDEVLFSTLNHPGASICWHHQAPIRGFTVRTFRFPLENVTDLSVETILEVYDRHIGPQTRVLVFPHVDNLVGIRHPVRELTELARKKGVRYVAVDGAQVAGMLPVSLSQSGVDFYATSPHKWVQAPKGTGMLYVHPERLHELRPMWVTWGQERWKGTVRIFEDYGTRNLASVLALGDAILFQLGLDWAEKTARLRYIHHRFLEETDRRPYLVWRSPREWQVGASLFAIEVRGQKSQDVFQVMYQNHGFVFRPFLTAELNALRISPNLTTSDEDIDRFFALLDKYYA